LLLKLLIHAFIYIQERKKYIKKERKKVDKKYKLG